jgi:DNA-binding NarL/FixJ family response regulator
MTSNYRIVLADDHVLVREALKVLLTDRDNLEVVGEAGDGLELLSLLRQEPEPDAVIVDISMPRLRGIEAIREIRRVSSSVKLLVFTMHKDEDLLRQAFIAGADGYLLKEDLAKELFIALDAIMEARVYVSPVLAKELKQSWLKVFIERKSRPV